VPAYLMQKGDGMWQVGVALSIAPDGTLGGCSVEATSGISDLDRLTCNLIHKRARFRSARWTDGSTVVGIYRTTVRWAVADAPFRMPKGSNPDLELTVQSLPTGVESPSLVRIMFGVDANGQMSSCDAEPAPSFEMAQNSPTLVPVACEQLMQGIKMLPVKDPTGKPVPSVQDAIVRFVVDKR